MLKLECHPSTFKISWFGHFWDTRLYRGAGLFKYAWLNYAALECEIATPCKYRKTFSSEKNYYSETSRRFIGLYDCNLCTENEVFNLGFLQ